MYEVRKAGRMFRVYDKTNEKYVGYTKSEKTANRKMNTLNARGFEGEIPKFFLNDGSEHGIDFDLYPK